jgi:polysaccharide biosynthesis PFTS motif protein
MITSPDRQFANMVQKVDFLIDGRLIKKDEALFLSCKKLRPENRKYMESAGLAYIDEPSGTISMGEMTRALGLFFLTARRCLKEESLALDTALRAVYFYIVWKSLAERVDIGRLISCADFGQQSVARNIILENDGCETYYYLDSANLGCFKARKDLGAGYRHNIYSFLHYTYFVSWNDFISEYFRSMACGVKEYLNFGCLWAEHLRLISDGQIDSNLKKVLRRKDPERKRRIVSVFDCGMHDHFMNTYEYGIEFLNGILHLIKSLPDIFVVFKEKKPRPYHKKISHRFTDILDLYSRLENHERCYFVSSSGNPSEIIASSDITISMPFTSTTFEAVSALRKAIYYDPDGRFADTYYYGIPGLVCRDSDGLPERVRHLLEMSGEEYARYINEHVRGKIEDYMDCRAITRLREHLSGVPA